VLGKGPVPEIEQLQGLADWRQQVVTVKSKAAAIITCQIDYAIGSKLGFRS
jgi:hypothetical protein